MRVAPGLCFVLEISRNGEFETCEFERFSGLEDDVCVRDYYIFGTKSLAISQ